LASPNLQRDRRSLRVAEFCERFGVSSRTAYRMMDRGQLRSVKVGGIRLIPIEAAEALLNPPKAA
jgi:excisionase family DNA binding protein